MHSEWRCPSCGPVAPLHVPQHIGHEIVQEAVQRCGTGPRAVPLWCPWPLLPGWTVTGVGWAGDERDGARAAVVACSGPAPLSGGPADIVLIAEEPGTGLGPRFAGIPGPDPGPFLGDAEDTIAHAKIKVSGHPTPLWSVKTSADRAAYAGEARGMWLYAIAWPAAAGYLLADEVALHDLTEWLPAELVFGAPSPYLHGKA